VLAVTDSASRFTLLLPDKAQVDAAPGRLAGAAARFDRMVDGFVKGRRAGTTLR
jgi:hypothetical protein